MKRTGVSKHERNKRPDKDNESDQDDGESLNVIAETRRQETSQMLLVGIRPLLVINVRMARGVAAPLKFCELHLVDEVNFDKINQHLMKEWLRIVEPVVKQRLCDYDERKSGKDVGPEPQDFLPWVVNHGRESGDPNFNEPVTIALRGLIPKSAQIRTSTIVCAHNLLDPASPK
ncbi:hypothetical protein SLS64_012326 [Diaporthe eres]